MKNINKVYNFFTTRYYDNIKYNHSTASLLRIFFERANKTRQSVSNLGNVYRNSKWSDLKVQNIKFSHVNSFLVQLTSLILLLIISFVLIFRLDYSTFTLLISNIFYIFWYALDITNYFLTLIALLIYSMYVMLTNNTYSFTPAKLSSHSNNTSSGNSSLLNLQTPNNLRSNQVNLVASMFKSHDSISRFSQANLYDEANNKSLNSVILSNTIESAENSLNITSFERGFFLNSSTHLSDSLGYKSNISLGDLNSIQSSYELNQLITNSLSESFRNAEYSRWLLKSSPFSENLSNSLFNFTQSKSLVGKSQTNSNLSNNNVWASTSLEANDIAKSNSLSSFNNILHSNINFFESSSIFNSKRLYFILQPKNSFTYLSNSQAEIPSPNTSTNSYHLMVNALQLDATNSVKNLYVDLLDNSTNYHVSATKSFNTVYNSKNNLVITDSLNLFVIDLNTSRNTNSSEFKYYNPFSYVSSSQHKLPALRL